MNRSGATTVLTMLPKASAEYYANRMAQEGHPVLIVEDDETPGVVVVRSDLPPVVFRRQPTKLVGD